MQLLIAPTEDFIFSEQTFFSADEALGQTVLSCTNAQGFAENDFIVLGRVGSDTAEIRQISSISADLTTITISVASDFIHVKDEEITKLRYNQRKFYRSTTETGTFSHLSSEGSPVTINVDIPEGTEFEDSGGSATSWYKATYYNSYSGIETSLSDAVAAKAGDAEHYTSIYKIKDEAGFKENSYITSELIDRYRLEAESEVESAIVSMYTVPLTTVPKIIQHIVTLLAAGNLLAKEYGMEDDTEISKTGQRKIDRAEELLQKIKDRDIILINSSGNELSSKSVLLASSSNAYSSSVFDKGEMFTLEDEQFRMADPTNGNGSTN